MEQFVSVLYREPKLLKVEVGVYRVAHQRRVSVLYREPKLLKDQPRRCRQPRRAVSVLYREPKLLKVRTSSAAR